MAEDEHELAKGSFVDISQTVAQVVHVGLSADLCCETVEKKTNKSFMKTATTKAKTKRPSRSNADDVLVLSKSVACSRDPPAGKQPTLIFSTTSFVHLGLKRDSVAISFEPCAQTNTPTTLYDRNRLLQPAKTI